MMATFGIDKSHEQYAFWMRNLNLSSIMYILDNDLVSSWIYSHGAVLRYNYP